MAIASNRRGVIVLDDDRELLAALEHYIVELLGRTVVAVHSLDALATRRDEALACDLAILDVNLGPGAASGLDCLAWLRRERFSGRVVFLTGHARSHPELLGLKRSNQVEVLEKPLPIEVLDRVINGS